MGKPPTEALLLPSAASCAWEHVHVRTRVCVHKYEGVTVYTVGSCRQFTEPGKFALKSYLNKAKWKQGICLSSGELEPLCSPIVNHGWKCAVIVGLACSNMRRLMCVMCL